ncbi:MAG: sulfatase-like hydrolase/transferase [Planctomycetaceae bacterium]|nr:sulfatase-like hydrolase/transferase [Planctomycetaceae bacterium]
MALVRTQRGAARLAAALALCVGSACGPSGRAGLELSAHFDPAGIVPIGSTGSAALPDVNLEREGGERWLSLQLTAEQFAPAPWPGTFGLERPEVNLLSLRSEGDGAPLLIAPDGTRLSYVEPWFVPTVDGELPDGVAETVAFTAVGPRLLTTRAALESLGPTFELRVPLGRGYRRGERRRVESGAVSGNGFLLWPQEAWRMHLPGGADRQFSCVLALAGLPLAGPQEPLDLELSFDGVEVLRRSLPVTESIEPELVEFSAPLPDGAGTLQLAVRGGPARLAVLAPRVDTQSTARPRTVAVFLADTFRADLLGESLDGGPLLPHLAEFGAGALEFDSARSPSNWTLPATASLFTGLNPVAHGVHEPSHSLPPETITLASQLRALGWRTAAITDGGFVRRAFGLAQGFEVFVEESRFGQLDVGFAHLEALLESPDPRPLFLLFHSYRAHEPYFVDEETRLAHGAQLGLGRDYESLRAAMGGTQVPHVADIPENRIALQELRGLYKGGARDLDRAFGRFLSRLEHHGRRDVVLFTSDHGEGFGDHDGFIGHGMGLWEEQVRVPLLVEAPGLAPARRADPVSLIDVPRSLCELLDLRPHRRWRGRAVFRGAPDGETLRYGLNHAGSAYAVRGAHKWIAEGEDLGERKLFHLRDDPEERAALIRETWPEDPFETLERTRPAWRVPVRPPLDAAPSSAVSQQLAALGYADGG